MDKRLSTLESDEQLLLTLTHRLLSSPYPGGLAEDVQILVGELPASLAIELPLPEGAGVIGSLVRADQSVQVVLDVDQPADTVVAFYRAQLEPAGWHEFHWPMRPGGFGFGSEAATVTFCQSRRGPSLTVAVLEAEGAPTDVRLNLQIDPRHSPCAMLGRPYGPMTSPIPNLRAPAGARTHGGGGSAVAGIAGTRPSSWKPILMLWPWWHTTTSNFRLSVGNWQITAVQAPPPGVPGVSATTKVTRGPVFC